MHAIGRVVLAFAVLACLAGVGAPLHAQETAPASWFVWGRQGGRTRTHQITETGASIATARDGIFVALDQELVALRTGEVSGPAWHCDWQTMDGVESPDTRLVGHRLDMVGPPETTTLLAPPHLEPLSWLVDEIEVVATLGTWAVLRRGTYAEGTCGAHGDSALHYTWIDLAHPRTVRPWHEARDRESEALANEMPPPDDVRARAEAAIRRRLCTPLDRESAEEAGCVASPARGEVVPRPEVDAVLRDVPEPASSLLPLDPSPEGVFPRFDGTQWRASHYFVFGVPYSYTDGDTAYGVDATIEGGDLAPRFDGDVVAPAAVLRFLRAHPRFALGGFSRATTDTDR